MALDLFKASPLPNPPSVYDPQYIRQLIRVIESYFSQLDSNTPNHAQKYTADEFIGGTFSGVLQNVTSAQKTALSATAGTVVFDTTLHKLCVYTGSAWQTVTSV